MFVGSESGDVFALNAKTGCTHWTLSRAGRHPHGGLASVRTSRAAAGRLRGVLRRRHRLGVRGGRQHGPGDLVAQGGRPHLREGDRLADAPRRPRSTCRWPASAKKARAAARYECCTFRGSVTALDANTGAVIWKSYTIRRRAEARGKNAEGMTTGDRQAAASGPRRRSIRRAARSTSRPATTTPARRRITTDAVIALDIDTGKHKLGASAAANDVWAGGCRPRESARQPTARKRSGPISTSRCRRC